MAETNQQPEEQYVEFEPQQGPLFVPSDAPEPLMYTEPAPTGPAGIANAEDMSKAVALASAGKITQQDALAQLMTDGPNQTTIRNHAATLLAKEAQEVKTLFDREAAVGRAVEAELLARKYGELENLQFAQRPIEKDIKRITTEAATNLAVANEPARNVNSPEKFAITTEQEGHLKAIEEVLTTHLANRGVAPTRGEVMATLGVAIGAPLAATAVNGPLAVLLATGVGGKFAYDSFVQVPKAIEAVSGIKNRAGLGYADQIAGWRAVVATLPPEQAIKEIEGVADWLIKNETLPGAAGKVFAFMNIARLYDSFDDTEWSKFQLSLKLQEKLDILGLGFDAAGALDLVGKAAKAERILGRLQGGQSLGKSVGNDLVNGANQVGASKGSHVGYGLSFDLQQLLPDGVFGTSAEVQNVLKNDLDKLVTQLQDRVSVTTGDEVSRFRDYVASNAEKHNGSIASFNSSTGEIILQHPRGAPYISEEVAKSAAAKWEAETGLKFEVVPADSYTTSKVGVEALTSPATTGKEMRLSQILPDVDNGDLIDVYRMAEDDMVDPSVGELMSAIARGGKQDRDIRAVAELLAENDALYNVPVKSVRTPDEWFDVPGMSRSADSNALFGKYNWRDNSIYLLEDAATSPRLVVHEAMHAAISQVIDVARSGNPDLIKAAKLTSEQRKSVDNLRGIYNDLRGQMSPEQLKMYGMSDVHEMISEAFTNKEFQKALKSVKLSEETTTALGLGRTAKNAWQALTAILGHILGFKADKANALASVIEESTRLLQAVPPNYQNMVGKLKSQVSAEEIMEALDSTEKAGRAASLSSGFVLKRAGIAGLHTAEDISSRFALGGDPIHRASRDAVNDRMISLLQENKERALLNEFAAKHINSLSKKEMARVVSVLEEGNDIEKDFNVMELAARGVTSEKEQRAYFAYRTLSNLNLDLKNKAINDSLSRKGFVQGYFKDGLLHHKAPAMRVVPSEVDGKKALNLITGEVQKIKADEITGSSNFVVRAAKQIEIKDKGVFTLFIGDNSTVRFGALKNQIPKRPGTFRRIYTDDNFGRVRTSAVIDGEIAEESLHLRTSKSKKDMDSWAKGMNTILDTLKTAPARVDLTFIEKQVGKWENPQELMDQINKGMWANYSKFEGHYNRSNEDYIESLVKGLTDDSLDKYKARGIKLRSIDDMENTLDPIKSMQAELTNVARMRNLNEWRDKWVDAWWNQFSELIPNHIKAGKSPIAAMSSPELQMSVYAGDSRLAQYAESQRNYILQTLGVKTLEERLLETLAQRFTASWGRDSRIMGLSGEKLIVAGHALRNADPLQFIRSFNFFTMLSAFNPAQLIVQSAGAMNAIAISPVHGLKAAYTAPLLRIAMASDNPKVWDSLAMVEDVAKFGLGNKDEFVRTVKMLKKSGLISNIVGTSMHSAENGRFNMFTGTVSKAGEKSAFFFNRGEEFTRLTAFDTARREWISNNPGKMWDTDEAMKEILIRTDDFTQNMTRANMAFYQRGVLSIPGQFLQYNLKLAANIIGAMTAKATGRPYRGFTMTEALSILAAHTVAYGMAGNGLMSLSDEVFGGLENLLGRPATDNEKLAFSQGAIASLVNEVSQLATGEDLKLGLGERLGVFEYYDKMARSIAAGDASFWEVVLGPTYGSASRLGALKNLVEPFRRQDFSTEGFAEALNNTGREFVSTWRNATKAYYAASNDGVIMNKQKDAIVTLTTPEIIAQALGIGSAAEAEAWRLFKAKSDNGKEVKELANTWLNVEWSRLQALNAGDQERADKLLKFGTTLIPTLPGDADLFWGEIEKHSGPSGSGIWKDRFTEARRDYLTGQYNIKDVVSTRGLGLTDVRPTEPQQGEE